MKETNLNNQYIFQYGLEFVRLSQREEENFKRLITQYGSLKKFPNAEIVSVCLTKKAKKNFTDDENYFFVQANELITLDESADKRRKSFFIDTDLSRNNQVKIYYDYRPEN